jgi:hypothetical protein
MTTGTERKRAWRERQKNAVAVFDTVATSRVDHRTALADVIRRLRTDVRLDHAHAADYELNRLNHGLVPRATAWFWKQVQLGATPSYAACLKAIGRAE